MKSLTIATGLLVALAVLPSHLAAQTTLAEAEQLSARTGRTLFVVAGRGT